MPTLPDELEAFRVMINAVTPGPVDTGWMMEDAKKSGQKVPHSPELKNRRARRNRIAFLRMEKLRGLQDKLSIQKAVFISDL